MIVKKGRKKKGGKREQACNGIKIGKRRKTISKGKALTCKGGTYGTRQTKET